MNSTKLIVSIYDETGNWPRPYAEAGYPVQLWDLQHEGCILQRFDRLTRLIDSALASGCTLHGLITAPPCTHFASSGARWWKQKDALPPGKKWNPADNHPDDGDQWSVLDYACAFAEIVLHLVELYQPHFWVLENPIGRLPSLVPALAPYRRMSFDPCDYGDPYTKKTVLYGRFNTALAKQPSLFVLPDYIHKMPGNSQQAALRSATPAGFAQAFFAAN